MSAAGATNVKIVELIYRAKQDNRLDGSMSSGQCICAILQMNSVSNFDCTDPNFYPPTTTLWLIVQICSIIIIIITYLHVQCTCTFCDFSRLCTSSAELVGLNTLVGSRSSSRFSSEFLRAPSFLRAFKGPLGLSDPILVSNEELPEFLRGAWH